MSPAAGLGVNLYPWDVAGDPQCPDRIAGLGADRVTLAAAYHTVRALSPRHPQRKVVTAGHSALYYRPDPAHWSGSLLQPAEASWAAGAFTEAAPRLREAGLKVYAWTILTHNQRLGTLHPEHSVVNAFGDPYPWALCLNSPEVRGYCALLAAEVAAQPDIDGIELESCGWYGYDHLHAHDKTGGVAFDQGTKFLLNLCFCAACEAWYTSAGLDGLRESVRGALEPVFRGDAASAALDARTMDTVGYMRIQAAARFQVEVVSAARQVRPDVPILLHTSPDPLAVGANPGSVPDGSFGAVLQCGGARSQDALTQLRAYADAMAKSATAQPLAATVNIVAGMGSDRDGLGAWVAELRSAGAEELRLYHAGLASAADLEAVRALAG
ncbi:hypothetical protein [Actinospica robiniae]|uniref:hypothetical protein n=1 Tax=Actinospica robiniae TaxID=304901 RepID=UPI000403EA42|nr:hypothetical protein [Actinospica robiniae]